MNNDSSSLSVDAHTHIICWGENPADGFLSPSTQKSLVSKTLIRLAGIHREKGDTMSEKLVNRLFNDLETTQLDHVVLFAQDAVYRDDGTIDLDRTHFFVSNDYVLHLATRSDKIIPCCSINPLRLDALQELDRVWDAGCRIVKIHTAIQGVSPDLVAFDPFYKHAADMGMVLVFHTGYEHSCKVISQKFTDPAKLQRALDHGGTIIAAHCGTCAFFDPEDYYPHFIEMMNRNDNLYGDTAVLAGFVRLAACKRLALESESITSRIIHGSDYPIPPSRIPHLRRAGFFPPNRKNLLELDLHIKRAYHYGPKYENLILDLLQE